MSQYPDGAPSGVEITGRTDGQYGEILTPEAVAFVAKLGREFNGRRKELLDEMRGLIAHLDGLSRCVFRTNHASNYLPLAGTLSRDKDRLLLAIDETLRRGRA